MAEGPADVEFACVTLLCPIGDPFVMNAWYSIILCPELYHFKQTLHFSPLREQCKIYNTIMITSIISSITSRCSEK